MIKLSRPYFLFFTLGDWGGYRYNEQKIMSRIGDLMNSYAKQSKPTFIAALGDNFYDRGVTSSTEDSWDLVWKNIYINNYNVMKEIPWYAILGNHDYYGGDISVKSEIERTKFCSNWYMPKNQYTHFDKYTKTYSIFLDTCKIYPELYEETMSMMNDAHYEISKSLYFLETKLIEAHELKSKWIFVYGHYHLFSNGYYGNYERMIYRLLPLLIKYDVDIYFCGHEHNFQLLKYDYNHMSENSYKRNDSYKRNNKLHFVVNGAGTFSSNVVHKNKNPIISTEYVSDSNGFTRQLIQDNKAYVQFINIYGVCEYEYIILKEK